MTKQQLFLMIYQATSSPEAQVGIHGVTDFDRQLSVHVARNSNGEISYITMEFVGPRACFLSSLIFDGSGHQGTGFSNFSMPKVKLNPRQRSLVLLSCLSFLIENGILNANFSYFAERINLEHQAGRAGFIEHYRRMMRATGEYLIAHPEYYTGPDKPTDYAQSINF